MDHFHEDTPKTELKSAVMGRESSQKKPQSSQRKSMCAWEYDEPIWESECGASFVFNEHEDSLEENSFKFCHKCGGRIIAW